MKITLIAAMAENRVIGKDNKLIWHFPKDLRYFKECTKGHHVIMGRKTFESMNAPLPKRTNIVVSRQKGLEASGCIVTDSLENALAKVGRDEQPFIIGGAQIYEAALPYAHQINLTVIHHSYPGDTYFPQFNEEQWKLHSSEKHAADERHPYPFEFRVYKKASGNRE